MTSLLGRRSITLATRHAAAISTDDSRPLKPCMVDVVQYVLHLELETTYGDSVLVLMVH